MKDIAHSPFAFFFYLLLRRRRFYAASAALRRQCRHQYQYQYQYKYQYQFQFQYQYAVPKNAVACHCIFSERFSQIYRAFFFPFFRFRTKSYKLARNRTKRKKARTIFLFFAHLSAVVIFSRNIRLIHRFRGAPSPTGEGFVIFWGSVLTLPCRTRARPRSRRGEYPRSPCSRNAGSHP